MNIEQIYTKCLAQGAYFIESNGEALVIDPLRETFPYIERAVEKDVKIKYIFETHFHADFVSGHIDLAKKTGAKIVYGPNAVTEYEAYIAQDGEEFKIGSLTLRVIHTPGHTMESSCFLLIDENGNEHALFTGDTLFIGDVGRPDLAQKASDMTQEDLAGILYDSLRNKIMVLPDHIMIYPAHGAGSACGKNMSKETFSTLGRQKEENYALRKNMTKQEFIKEVTDGLLPPPGYFGMNVSMNKQGYDSIEAVMKRGLNALDYDSFSLLMKEEDILILDTRNANSFAEAHIPGSLFVGLEGQFAPWVGGVIPNINQKLILVIEDGKEEETVRRLARVGYDHVLGYLEGGLETWLSNDQLTSSIPRISAEELLPIYQDNGAIIDVRKPSEFEAEHIENLPNLPLDFIEENISEYPKGQKLILHCAGGYRSMIAASILQMKGYEVSDVVGGYGAISKTAIPKTNFVCPSTLK